MSSGTTTIRPAALAGLRVIDFGQGVSAPHCARLFADYGADVIKVEPPEGDLVRQIGPARHAGMGPIFLNTNRGKRSICLDLKKPEVTTATGSNAEARRVEVSLQ